MFKKNPTKRTIFLAPTDLVVSMFAFQKGRALVAESIDNMVGTALFVIFDLCPWPFQIAMVIEQLHSTQELLRAIPNQRYDLGRPHKAVAVNESDDFTITRHQLHGSNGGSAFEARKAGEFHRSTIRENEEARRRQLLQWWKDSRAVTQSNFISRIQ